MDASRPAIEEWLRANGVPHLIDGYDARADVLGRMRPLLLAIFALGLALTVRPDWPWWGQALAACAALALASGAGIMLNVLRRERWNAARIGPIQVIVLIATPALASLTLGGTPGHALVLLLGAVLVAGAGYVLVSVGVIAALVHLTRATLSGSGGTLAVAGRALPLMLALLLFLFLTNEIWQTLGTISGWRFVLVWLVFLLLAAVVLVVGLRRERLVVCQPAADEDIAEHARATPAAPLVAAQIVPAFPPLTRAQRWNVQSAFLLALATRVVAVGCAVGVFMVAFGMLVVSPARTAEWVGGPPRILWQWGDVALTEPLLRVAALLAAFAALSFAVSAVADAHVRDAFINDELVRMRTLLAAWAYYQGAP